MLTLLVLVALLVTAAAPELSRWRARQSALAAGVRLAMQVEGARAAAVNRRRAHGIRFEIGTQARWSLVADGDGDGIRSADLRAGVDLVTLAHTAASPQDAAIRLGLDESVPPLPGSARPTTRLPMAPTGLLTASPMGTLSTGTVYLCHREGVCVAVRVYGPGGRVGLWQFDTGGWKRRW